MNKWVIFSDVDGTIYGFPDKKLSNVNKDKLQEIYEKGVNFVIATGNPPYEKIQRLADIAKSRYIITSGGASVYDNFKKEYIHVEYIPLDEARKLFEIADRINARLYYFGLDQYYLKNHNEEMHTFLSEFCEYYDWILDGRINDDINKIEVYGTPEEVRVAYEEFVKANLNLNIINLKTHLEITKTGVSKASGIKWLCENVFNVSEQDVMAIGDSQNDIPMLEYVGYSYAMDNAGTETKKAAKFYTSDVRQDGLAEAIDDFLYRTDFELKKAISQGKMKKS
ncbi:Cof-type HAD-IIB family hydrolase [Mycoplasmopsis pullorum]|uniref:HAD family hydrolase n=1 Tax=Mycoplasmopsis pullorum TaxID=48003 RepID=UPI00111A4D3D|nr:HAD family hydrolase [Mycoplasmopsis pullorum]TNK82267.1 Cof-type HAD-IIB family hydrolase [Mycoplasmopsis pullorum]TNK82420.1 Cof-type HAD-IIB family hydrolase [Mycoplasmopsis pullorum]TNK84890.1 Cof-type HAD-IIB family hydrolase [Mycoplasmopsis pullorum]TNK85234.1 Cof-type HAD-IIB family hydrolase [Mycoplasmopsis pullorum]TNK86078.1 Cof-type HAD-IIB family hydrolase [Mycoplasmopsis pullorum]